MIFLISDHRETRNMPHFGTILNLFESVEQFLIYTLDICIKFIYNHDSFSDFIPIVRNNIH